MRISALFVCFGVLLGCASKPLNFDGIQSGMDKDQVLQTLGNPKRTYRMNSVDHWVYVDFENGREKQRHIAFEDGVVVKMFRPTPQHTLTEELEAKGSLEEYEKSFKAKRSNAGFKSIDGAKPSDSREP